MKKVSKKKIVFVEIDEEITTLFQRIEKMSYKDIYLVVPKRAVLLQSIVNLKILKQKLEDVDKNMALITNDINGMKLAHQAEIKVFDHWNIENEGAEEKEPSSALLKPIRATSNEVDDSSPSRLPKKKSSIFEVVRTLRGQEKGFSLRTYLRDRKKNKHHKDPFHIYLPGGNKRFITGALALSAAVFFIIAYIVLPGATLYIEPTSDVITRSVNVNLTRSIAGVKDLQAYPVSTTIELSIDHPATGIVSEGQRASGELTIINTSSQEWPLVAETRFQTEDGLVFRLQNEVTVPRGSAENPGSVVARVLADPVDAEGIAIGSRGNIGPSKFFLPGLRDSSRETLYAESYDSMTGGETNVTALVTEDDLVAAREKLEAELQSKALESLRKEVLSESNRLGLELDLLEDSDTLVYGTASVDLPYSELGTETESFEITGSLTLSGVAYDSAKLYEMLKTALLSAETPGKQLIRINDSSVSMDVLEADTAADEYKFTAHIQGVEEYEIDPELEGGSQLVKKIKEHIAGQSVEEAERYVQNLAEVNRVEIKMWPGWSPTIPSLPENIRIKSLNTGEGLE